VNERHLSHPYLVIRKGSRHAASPRTLVCIRIVRRVAERGRADRAQSCLPLVLGPLTLKYSPEMNLS